MAVSIVCLGDACAGKTALLRALAGEPYAVHYTPSIGATHYPALGGGMDGWDYPGLERFGSTRGSGRQRGFDVALVVCDMSARESFAHIEAWADEYLQFGFSGGARMPGFVIVGTKSDRAQVVTQAELESYAATFVYTYRVQSVRCARAVVTSAKNNAGISELRETILAVHRDCAPPAVELPPVWPRWSSGLDVQPNAPPAVLLRGVLTIEHDTVDIPQSTPSGLVHVPAATIEVRRSKLTDSVVACVGADMAVLVMRLRFAAFAVSQIMSWRDELVHSSMLRRPGEGLGLTIVGFPSTDYTDDTRAAAERAAHDIGAQFILGNVADKNEGFWHHAVDALHSKRATVIVDRSMEQSTCAADTPELPVVAITTLDESVQRSVTPSTSAAESPSRRQGDPSAGEQALISQGLVDLSSVRQDVALMALNRRVMETTLDFDRREAVYKAMLDQERADRNKDVAALRAENSALRDEVTELRLGLKLLWDEVDQLKRAAAGAQRPDLD